MTDDGAACGVAQEWEGNKVAGLRGGGEGYRRTRRPVLYSDAMCKYRYRSQCRLYCVIVLASGTACVSLGNYRYVTRELLQEQKRGKGIY